VAGRVYSERFIQTNLTNTHVIFTVPAGKRAVIRTMTATNLATAVGQVTVWINGVILWNSLLQVADRTKIAELRGVAYAGEEINMLLEGASMIGQIHGYLFDDQAGAAVTAGDVREDPFWRFEKS
jgi:hypothetical protein